MIFLLLMNAGIGSAVSSALFGVLSKFISVNIGVSKCVGAISIGPMSKSVGNGKMSFSGTGMHDVRSVGMQDGFCAYVSSLLRARINAARISWGISSDNVSLFVFSFSWGVGCGVFSGCFSPAFFCGVIIFGNFGFGMVISGFFVRTIIAVVAMYNGVAANNSTPNTKPPNPRSSARANLCHCAPLKILNLNIKYKIAHVQIA